MNHWINSFLVDALFWSYRSHDIQTKCGCVFATKDNTPISFGYNGFIRNADTSKLPTTRPDKYPFMIHSEQNAIYNSTRQGKSLLGATAYITGKPCTTCLQAMWQVGIDTIYYSNFNDPVMCKDAEQVKNFNILMDIMYGKLSLHFIDKKDIPLDQLQDTMDKLRG